MPSSDREQLPRRRSNRELLDHIYAEGERFRRRRRRLNVVGALSGVVALAGGAAVVAQLPGESTPQNVAARGVAAPASPGSSTSFTTTTVEPLELPPELQITTVPPPGPAAPAPTIPPPAGGPATTAAPAPTTPPAEAAGSQPAPDQPSTRVAAGAQGVAASTMPAPGDDLTISATPNGPTAPPADCVNSADAACGPFRWEPEPGPNAPLVVTVTARPRLGDPRTFDFSVAYEDADAPLREDCRMVDFGDGGTVAASSCAVPACLATYGPWTPPAREPGYAEASATHTFPGPGTYVVRFSAASGGMCGHPYASTGTGSTEVVVP